MAKVFTAPTNHAEFLFPGFILAPAICPGNDFGPVNLFLSSLHMEMNLIVNRSAPPGPVVPGLIYDDLRLAMEWLCETFGFTERLRVQGDDGTIGHAQLSIGDGAIFLGPSRQSLPGSHEAMEFRQPRPGETSCSITVRVSQIENHYEKARNYGVTILRPLQEYPFGEKQYTALDLAGYSWNFTESTRDVRPEEWGATSLKYQPNEKDETN